MMYTPRHVSQRAIQCLPRGTYIHVGSKVRRKLMLEVTVWNMYLLVPALNNW